MSSQGSQEYIERQVFGSDHEFFKEVPYIFELLMENERHQVKALVVHKEHNLLLDVWMVDPNRFLLNVLIDTNGRTYWAEFDQEQLVQHLKQLSADPDNADIWKNITEEYA